MINKRYLISLLALLTLSSCGQPEQAPKDVVRPVKVFKILGPEDVFHRSFPGQVAAAKKADLAFLVSGQIIEFPVKEGDFVQQGQLIAKIDPTDYQIAVDEALSKVSLEQVQLERLKPLLAEQFVSQSKYDEQKTALDIAAAELETAQQNLEYTELQAPFDGEIAKRYVENFQTVQQKEPIVHFHNRDNIDITVQLPESLAIRKSSDRKAVIKVEFDSAPGTRYPATIKEVSSQADPDTKTYRVTLTLKAPEQLNIFPGMTTTVHAALPVINETAEGKYKIPAASIFVDDTNKSYVWVLTPDNRVQKNAVTLGPLENGSILILEGLEPGMVIVAAGAKFLRDGMEVRPLDK